MDYRNLFHSWSAAVACTILTVYWFAFFVAVSSGRLA
jgi:hypothetical protein